MIQRMDRLSLLISYIGPQLPTAAVLAMYWLGSRPGHARPMETGREQHLSANSVVCSYIHKFILLNLLHDYVSNIFQLWTVETLMIQRVDELS